jgi:hypothetical protein
MDAAAVLVATVEDMWEKKRVAAALMMDSKCHGSFLHSTANEYLYD